MSHFYDLETVWLAVGCQRGENHLKNAASVVAKSMVTLRLVRIVAMSFGRTKTIREDPLD